MADKNDARELHPSEKARQWLKENFMPEYLAKENGTLVSVVGLLEHYAAALTQERDALRQQIADIKEVARRWGFMTAQSASTKVIEICDRDAAEESQPK